MVDNEKLWSIHEAAEYLGVHVETLRRWRNRGYGPPVISLVDGRGGMLRYHPADVREWLGSRTEPAGAANGR
jgi:DNA-binding transcriptional MerR regulator